MKKRLIDANALLSTLQNRHDALLKSGEMIVSGAVKGVIRLVHELPTVDAVEAVRCRDCEKRHTSMCHAGHGQADMDFCSHGIRKAGAK